jgi:hypothetical protein
MASRECYHCKQWIEKDQAHDCWTTTEAALTQDLTEDLRDAWERVRKTAAGFGDQRIYASHNNLSTSDSSENSGYVRGKNSLPQFCCGHIHELS